jgi:hypothetical protein
MEPPPATDASPELPFGRMQGRQAFTHAVRTAMSCAARERWSLIILSDTDFSDWPLGERAVVESLHAWAGRGRSMQLLASDFRPLRERHPRLVQWRVTWSHLVQAHACASLPAGALPRAIWTPTWTMERLDTDHFNLVASDDPVRRGQLKERLQACWNAGTPSFAATVLGL